MDVINLSMSPIKIQSKSDQVVSQIIDMILEGKLKPGDRLPVEDALAKNFGVSRVTIREAFKNLSLMGLVDIRQGDGTFVKTISPDFYMRPLLPMMILNPQNMDQLYDARRAVECGAARSAALYRTSDDLNKLKYYQEQMQKYFHSFSKISKEQYTSADEGFHCALIEASHNFYFSKIFETIYSILITGIKKTSRTHVGRKASIVEHAKIIEAIEKQDADLAESCMSEHLINAKKFYFDELNNEIDNENNEENDVNE